MEYYSSVYYDSSGVNRPCSPSSCSASCFCRRVRAGSSVVIGAGTCTDHAPAHPLSGLHLAKKFGGDWCRVSGPISPQTLLVPDAPPIPRKNHCENGLSGAAFVWRDAPLSRPTSVSGQG